MRRERWHRGEGAIRHGHQARARDRFRVGGGAHPAEPQVGHRNDAAKRQEISRHEDEPLPDLELLVVLFVWNGEKKDSMCREQGDIFEHWGGAFGRPVGDLPGSRAARRARQQLLR